MEDATNAVKNLAVGVEFYMLAGSGKCLFKKIRGEGRFHNGMAQQIIKIDGRETAGPIFDVPDNVCQFKLR